MHTTPYIVLLFIGYLIFTIDKKKEDLPVPPILTLIGIGLFFIPYFSSIEVTENLIYHIFLPGLLFISAYRFPPSALKENGGIIGFFATIGLILTVILLGSIIFIMSTPFISMSFAGAILIAAMLTPTDPVSVASILKQSSGDEMMADVVEGESLINDGTSIVIFSVVSGIFLNNEPFSFSFFLGEFLLVSLGGIFVGLLFGWLFSKAIHFTHHKEYQVMLSIVVAYGIFNLAEFLDLSGVLATVFAGIMLSFEFGRTIKEDHFRESLDNFWGIVEISILSLLFLLIGIVSADHLSFNYWWLAILIFLASIIVRFIIIAGTTQVFPKWRQKIGWRKSFLLSWSGLKGTMSVFLILSLSTQGGERTDVLLSLTFAAVLLSLIIQSIGIYPLSKRLLK
ncbi:sodium:proton antiporter [Halobacillus halophilus]|uniref:Na+/H+ antiporter family protein n=1 Tax=Halobacillus halophilus (strain ATCC 35676 / DSM 2266 / JCM 20832 / KCTC 3685 / LMG 17431 / NBRC 102448 / NCIMB 2269) TaxID=866895 RepID=I0JK38_HALH3|nr:sodium:proton antiporter [Halobacillus halophilus]ASF38658.1 sodium:proton antiporter [Halobacillus halophilus]CCG44507.1 Na+/H+ antiporter family protein [Halobacillus halophilus DSM 2266]